MSSNNNNNNGDHNVGDKVCELYDAYNQLDSAANITECESLYISILSAVKGSQQEKQLCSPFITKFFVHFPKHYDTAIDALLDLCEDDDLNVRRQAIKELPSLCRERKEYVPKMADVLAQLLQTEDNTELTIVYNSLNTLAKCDAKGFLGGLFSQIMSGEDMVRDRAVKFLNLKFKSLCDTVFTKEDEEYFVTECRKVMQDVSKDEFLAFMSMLSALKLAKTLTGQQTLLDMICEQAELNTPFDDTDIDFTNKLLLCIRHAIPFFSQFIPSTEFVKYICVQVLPHLEKLESIQSGIELDIVQLLAEMCPFVSGTSDAIELEKCESAVLSKLLQYMPTPPTDAALSETNGDEPSLQFSHVECLLFAFHQLAKHNQQFFSDANSERVKDFKLRLQYLARGIQSYITKLRKHLSTVKGESLKTDENKLKVMALKATSNINTLIRDLFKVPPSFKSTITLSWKPPVKGANIHPPHTTTQVADNLNAVKSPETVSLKRQPITAPDNTDSKRERKLYAPPSGKFSAGVNQYYGGGRGGRGTGGGSGGGRGTRGGFGRGGRRPYFQRFRWSN